MRGGLACGGLWLMATLGDAFLAPDSQGDVFVSPQHFWTLQLWSHSSSWTPLPRPHPPPPAARAAADGMDPSRAVETEAAEGPALVSQLWLGQEQRATVSPGDPLDQTLETSGAQPLCSEAPGLVQETDKDPVRSWSPEQAG